MAATPAIAAADRAGVRYTLHEYELDPRADAFGLEAAEKLGFDPARVLKTLVVSLDGQLAFALVPAHAQLDLRARSGSAPASRTRRGPSAPRARLPAGSARSRPAGRSRPTWTPPRSTTRPSSSTAAAAASSSSSRRPTSSASPAPGSRPWPRYPDVVPRPAIHLRLRPALRTRR